MIETQTYNRPERDEQLYVKRGRRYVPVVTDENPVFYCDGVWLVKSNDGGASRRCIHPTASFTKLADLPDPLPLARIELHRDAIVKALNNRWEALRDLLHNKGTVMLPSLNDLAGEIVRVIEKAEQARRKR